MRGDGAGQHAAVGFPFWVNEVAPFASTMQRRPTQPCSLLRLRDLFRCDVTDPGECWQHILLSSYMTDFRWLLTTVPELSAVTGRLVLLSGERGTATLRHTIGESPPRYTATPPSLDRVNPFLAALREHAQATPSSHATLSRERLTVLEPPLPLSFGTHHTKMALLVNSRGLRVSIFTANLLEQDWCWKSEGIYVQDFPWKTAMDGLEGDSADAAKVTAAAGNSSRDNSSTTTRGAEFAAHLCHYLIRCGLSLSAAFTSLAASTSAAGPLGIFETNFLPHIDFSAAAVWLVSCVPGTYPHGEVSHGYRVGMCRLAEVLRRSAQTTARAPESVDLSWQYSSQGSLNPTFLNSLQAAMCGESVVAVESGDAPRGVREVQVVYPTEEEVRNSWEGWRGGASLPLRVQCCDDFVNERLHRWGSCVESYTGKRQVGPRAEVIASHTSRENAVDVDELDREGSDETTISLIGSCTAYRQFALPHIKSYAAVAPDRSHIRWFFLTSANLSQAAWGSLSRRANKRGPRQQLVRSYELGVLYDSHSVVDPSASCWFSVVAKSSIELPTARNSRAILYETPLGAVTSAACLYMPYNLLYPTPYASTSALRARRCGTDKEVAAVATAALDCRDVPWVLDVPHRGRDAYGLEVEEAFESTFPPPLSKWRPRTRAIAMPPPLNTEGPRKRAREA
ncbi:hypothetical protein LSCM1_02817 [Leishmania martiniquensis]|uniref:Tyrosyl-DNA phosphodiesterase-like protein n=1 Tax=Leishmania martiniquensis TaxID=1580590 RepID=A0A836G7J8_9TRYP|nr:hypothetical protein LSCM1_02817 [Leishmania martiniquensis]